MKKEGRVIFLVALLVLSISLISFVIAQEDAKVEEGYDCLKDKVEGRCEDLSAEELAFTVLAIGKCSSELEDASKDDACWPASSCRLRDTALAVLAYDRMGKNTDDVEDYLLEQRGTPDNLVWYLEIDADEESVCTIIYGGNEKEVTIREDKRISGSAGSCLTVSEGGYWLKIDDSCYETNFTISCDKNFLTTLLYKKEAGSTVYVSSRTNSAPSEGKTEEKVNAFCFGKTSCDYEGSLWATLALAENSHDVSPFLPYLIAMAEDNEKYFPSTFLYLITDYDDYFSQIIDEQKNDYWKIDSSYGQFYDTALALLALQGLDAEQASSAKSYLLEVQGEDGCWRNNIRDTAFILYAAWPRTVSAPVSVDYCEDYEYHCTPLDDCAIEDTLDMQCYTAGRICCKTKPAEKTCLEKEGIICEENQKCTGSTVPAVDTTDCCLASCITESTTSECEEQNDNCRYSCLDDEEEKIYECDAGKICCASKPEPESSYWWIWLLIILIILVVVGIIFKDRLRVFLFNMKNKFKKGLAPATTSGRPGFPPAPPRAGARMMPPRPRMILPRQQPRLQSVARPQARMPARRLVRPSSRTDKELEETLKKLKKMSK